MVTWSIAVANLLTKPPPEGKVYLMTNTAAKLLARNDRLRTARRNPTHGSMDSAVVRVAIRNAR
jgi:hypothetical protein